VIDTPQQTKSNHFSLFPFQLFHYSFHKTTTTTTTITNKFCLNYE